MTTAVGSGETRASRPACLRGARWVRVVAAFVLVTLSLIVPPFGTQPATAAPPAVSLTLTQSSADSAIGSALTLTATVIWSGGESPEPPGGWYVEFTGTGDGGWSSGPTRTTARVATYTRTSPVAQTETITARLVSPDCSETSNLVTHEWWRSDIEINEPNANTQIATSYTLAGRVVRDGQPVDDAQVSITIITYRADFNPAVGPTRTTLPAVRTESGGRFARSWSSAVAAHERVEIGATTDDGFRAQTVTSHTWSGLDEPSGLLTLQAPSQMRVGERVLAKAQIIMIEGGPITNPDVEFITREGWMPPNDTPEPTDTASLLYDPVSAPQVGLPGVRASENGQYLATSTRFWQPTITFVSPNSTTRGEQKYPATVIVTDLGVPQAGVKLTFAELSGEFASVYATVTTDRDGRASAPIARPSGSSVALRVTEVPAPDTNPADGAPIAASAETTHAWVTPAPDVRITLAAPDDNDQTHDLDESVESRVGTRVPFTARVTSGQNRLQGWDVAFAIDADDLGTVATNADGEAVIRTTRPSESRSRITATVTTVNCGVVRSKPITYHWFVPTLELAPVTATSTTGATATVTARLHHGDANIEGQQIRLTIDSSAAGEPTKIITGSTQGDGTATFPWGRTKPGTDDLTAIEVTDVLPQQASATHLWEAPPVTPRPVTPEPITPEPITPEPVTPPAVINEPPVIDEPSTEPSDEPSESQTPTSSPSPSPTTEPPNDVPATSKLVDGPEVGRPGADIEVSGNGCQAGQHLTVSLGETALGETRAAADGTFYLRAVVPDLPLGRYVLRSTCGKTIGDPNVDITSPQVDKARAAIAAVGVTTASTFAFFLLIAKGVISFLPRRPL